MGVSHKKCETILLDTLTEHLKSIATETNQKIRTAAKAAWLKLKQIDPDRVKETLETALREYEIERQKKADIRKRKREENQKKTQPSYQETKDRQMTFNLFTM